MTQTPDTSAEAVERMALIHDQFNTPQEGHAFYAPAMRASTHRGTAATLRALAAERNALKAELEAERQNRSTYSFFTASLMGATVLGFDYLMRSDNPGCALFHGGRPVINNGLISFDGIAIMPAPYWKEMEAHAKAAEAERDRLREATM